MVCRDSIHRRWRNRPVFLSLFHPKHGRTTSTDRNHRLWRTTRAPIPVDRIQQRTQLRRVARRPGRVLKSVSAHFGLSGPQQHAGALRDGRHLPVLEHLVPQWSFVWSSSLRRRSNRASSVGRGSTGVQQGGRALRKLRSRRDGWRNPIEEHLLVRRDFQRQDIVRDVHHLSCLGAAQHRASGSRLCSRTPAAWDRPRWTAGVGPIPPMNE